MENDKTADENSYLHELVGNSDIDESKIHKVIVKY